MKKVVLIIDLIVLLLIVLTSRVFHNDYTYLFYFIILFFLTFNVTLIFAKKYWQAKTLFFLASISQLVYCLLTISIPDEVGSNTSRVLRLFSIHAKIDARFWEWISFSWILSMILVLCVQCYLFLRLRCSCWRGRQLVNE